MSAAGLVILGALAGAAASGGIQASVAWFDRKRRRRVAARLIYGDIVFAEAAFRLIGEQGIWSPRLDFGSAFETWREVRADFAAVCTALEWTQVGSFYANLERSARAAAVGGMLTGNDRVVCESMVRYAEDASPHAAKYIARSGLERDELVRELALSARESSDDLKVEF
jgi:hypothetical protein